MRGAAPWALVALAFACAREDVIATLREDGGPSSTDALRTVDEEDSGAARPDGAPRLAEDAGVVEGACARPPLILGADDRPTCGSALAARTFRFALCTCAALIATQEITADAFDSRVGPASGQILPGGVGVNGEVSTNARLSTSGSLWVAGNSGVNLSSSEGRLEVGADLAVRGPLSSEATVVIGRDARVAGRVRAPNLTVGRTLTVPEGSTVEITNPAAGLTIARAPVSVEPPCGCETSNIIDVPGIVARHRTNNDNALMNVNEETLSSIRQPTTVELGCGRFFFRRIDATARLRLAVTGRAIAFVAENVHLDAGLEVALGPGAELDFFVAGTFVSSGALDFGDFRRPTRTRLFVGASGTLQLSGGGTFAGNLYAPAAELVTSAPLEVFGSVFVRRVSTSSPLRFHFDVAVLKAGEDCTAPPPTMCMRCGDCPNTACVNGVCGACQTDADCCAPLFCARGQCEPSPI